jgi:transposase
MEHTRFVGLDIHKERISISVAESGRSGALEYLGEIANDPGAISKLCERLLRSGKPLAFCYEAGPCGYGVHRQLTKLGHRCDVVAPSLIPKKSGDRVKTNRRDATMLARLHRAGELTPVWVPDADHEAMRDLIRLRSAVRQIVTRASASSRISASSRSQAWARNGMANGLPAVAIDFGLRTSGSADRISGLCRRRHGWGTAPAARGGTDIRPSA